MPLHLEQSDILATFDKLVSAGEILYGPSKITAIIDQNFPVTINILELSSGPKLMSNSSNSFPHQLCPKNLIDLKMRLAQNRKPRINPMTTMLLSGLEAT
jgi:hypothetical protein